MNQLATTQPIALPEPTTPINIRRATLADMPFMDALQKKHSRELGFFSRAMFEGYITKYRTLVAETADSTWHGRLAHDESTGGTPVPRSPIGYVCSTDRYLKRDELGAVFQLCVDPNYRRGFIAAALLKAVFEQSAYGCKLYCCWCAQDLAANRFWEAMGFVPIAYRAGGRGKRMPNAKCRVPNEDGDSIRHSELGTRHSPRIHIFWQKRIRSGDNSTPYWFPAKTEGGAIREDRIILPIPPGMNWWDELPVLVPEVPIEAKTALPSTVDQAEALPSRRPAPKPVQKNIHTPNGIRITPPPVEPVGAKTSPRANATPRTKGTKRPKAKLDPVLTSKVRELRDKFLEQLNTGEHALPASNGKYDVARLAA